MPEADSEPSTSRIVLQAWSKYADFCTQTSQFYDYLSILDEIETLANVERFSVLSLERRGSVSSDIHTNDNYSLSLSDFQTLFQNYNNNISLVKAIEAATKVALLFATDNESTLEITEPRTSIESIPLSSTFVGNNFDYYEISHSKGLNRPTDTDFQQLGTPNSPGIAPSLSTNKTRADFKGKVELKRAKIRHRKVSSISLSPRYSNDSYIDKDENDPEYPQNHHEIEALINGEHEGIRNPYSKNRVLSLSALNIYSTRDQTGSMLHESENGSNSFEEWRGRRVSSTFSNPKRSNRDIRLISQQNDHITFLEDSVKKQESELIEKSDRIIMLERECKDYQRKVYEMEEAEVARTRKIVEVENVVKMTQQEMMYRRQHDNKITKAFINTFDSINSYLGFNQIKRRKSSCKEVEFKRSLSFKAENPDSLPIFDTKVNQTRFVFSNEYIPKNEPPDRPSTAPSMALENQNNQSANAPSQRPSSDGLSKKRKQRHVRSSSSVFSVSPEETAADYDEKLDSLNLDEITTTYLKELFRSSQQKVINIVYNQLNELKDLNTKLNDADGKVKYLVAANEQLSSEYQLWQRNIEEYGWQIEEKYRLEAQAETEIKVKDQVAKMKKAYMRELSDERQTLEAQMTASLEQQVQAQVSNYLNQIDQLKLEIETYQNAQHELEEQLRLLQKHEKFNIEHESTYSLQDELQAVESEKQHFHLLSPTVSSDSVSSARHSRSFKLPTDENHELDFVSFFDSILVPIAKKQGVSLKSIKRLRRINDSKPKKMGKRKISNGDNEEAELRYHREDEMCEKGTLLKKRSQPTFNSFSQPIYKPSAASDLSNLSFDQTKELLNNDLTKKTADNPKQDTQDDNEKPLKFCYNCNQITKNSSKLKNQKLQQNASGFVSKIFTFVMSVFIAYYISVVLATSFVGSVFRYVLRKPGITNKRSSQKTKNLTRSAQCYTKAFSSGCICLSTDNSPDGDYGERRRNYIPRGD